MPRAPLDPASPEAHGSGVAASVAFFQVALIGYLGFLIYRLVGQLSGDVPMGMDSVTLMVLFPAWLGIWLHLPTDALTLMTARVGAGVGVLGIAGVAALMVGYPHAFRTPGGDGGIGLMGILVANAAACLAAFASSEAVRPNLRGYGVFPLVPALRRHMALGVLCGAAAGGLAAWFGGVGGAEERMLARVPTVLIAASAFGALAPLLVSALLRRARLGWPGALQVPCAVLVTMGILVVAQKMLWQSLLMQAIVVLFAVIVGYAVFKGVKPRRSPA